MKTINITKKESTLKITLFKALWFFFSCSSGVILLPNSHSMVWANSDLWTEKFFQNTVITLIEIAKCERGMFVLVLTSALLMMRNT